MKKILQTWKFPILIFAVILGLGFILRVFNLTIIPVFADEAIYIRWAQVMRAVPELRFLPLSDGKQPLFMWSVIPFFKLFSDPLFAGRFLSVLCGVGTTIGVGVLAWLLFQNSKSEYRNSKQIPNYNDKNSKSLKYLKIGKLDIVSNLEFSASSFAVSLLAAFLYAISPFALFFDRMALADSMLSFFGIWTFIFSLSAIRYQRLDMAMLAGFTLGGAFLTKSPALYFALLLPTTILFFDFKKTGCLVRLFTTFGLWIVTWVIGYGFYNIQRLGTNFQMLHLRSLDYVYPFSHLWERPLDPLKPFLMEVVRWFWIMGPSVFILLILAGILWNIKRFPKQIIFLTIVAFAPIFASAEFAKVFTARYIFFSIPFLIILSASVLYATKQKWILGIIGIFIVHSLFNDYHLLFNPQLASLPRSERSGYLEEWTAGYGLHEVSEYLRNEQVSKPNEKIVVGTEGYFGTLPDGLQMYLNDVPAITIIGVGWPISNVHTSLLESKKAGNKTYLVVNSTRFSGDADKLGLHLIQKYPKAQRPEGMQEGLLFFELY